MLASNNQFALGVGLMQKRICLTKKVCVRVVDVFGFKAEAVSTVGAP